ncbi:MAG TPA: ring-cleaving dioxygenase [Isosphaeraceae bacterium]|nr:ring-cleaving dioxygenase [Isosphaeraceae bacterium]
MKVGGIHHVTAISAAIAQNLEFYTGVLGLRLVKKSVNQDDIKAYHLFYADTVGSPGTDLTFFDWPEVPANQPGAGNVALTSFKVESEDSLGFWRERLTEAGHVAQDAEDPQGRLSIQFADPEGQALELVAAPDLRLASVPWDKSIPAEHALRGLLSVEIPSARPDSTRKVLRMLGFETVLEEDVEVLQVNGDAASSQVRLRTAHDRRFGRPGAGGIHHVAFRVRDDDELRRFQQELESAGLNTSGYVDRFWFHSLYFREPGGVLFELATEGPGMGSDEDMAHLGEHTVLPPFLEPRREAILAGLKPLPEPAYLQNR